MDVNITSHPYVLLLSFGLFMPFSFPRPAHLFLVAAALLGLLLGCSGGKETTVVIRDEEGAVPTPTEARKALNEALQAFNEYCLAPSAQGYETTFPIALVRPSSGGSSYRYRQLWSLTQAGLLDTSLVQNSGDLPVHRFALTKAGHQTQFEIAQGQGYRKMFCYAVPRVTQLDSIKARFNSGPNALAQVWFTYGYADLNSWVESPSVRRTFSGEGPLPAPSTRQTTEKLLIRVDSAWVDRRLTGYERPPERPHPPSSR